jgi:hypothetical protein
VQYRGCYALGKIAEDNAANQRIIAEKGGVEAAFHAMTQHSHDKNLHHSACSMIQTMAKCEAARPAIQTGKPVLDAAREYFSKDSVLCMYINIIYQELHTKELHNIIYRELHKKDGKKKHRRKGAAPGQERDKKATSAYEYGLSGLFNETRAAQGQERDNKGEKKKHRRKGAAQGQERDKKATSSYEYDLYGLFNETRAAQGQDRDNKGDLDLFY